MMGKTHIEFNAESMTRFKGIVARYEVPRSALLPTLYLAQEQFGYLSPPVLEYVAKLLGIPPAHVFDAASFYVLFKRTEMGHWCLQLCNNITCHMMGAEKLLAVAKEELGLGPGETTPDKTFSLSCVQCLGSCDTAPVVCVNEEYFENLNTESFRELLRRLKEKTACHHPERSSITKPSTSNEDASGFVQSSHPNPTQNRAHKRQFIFGRALSPERHILLNNIRTPGLSRISVYEGEGGYSALKKALARTPDAIIEEVKSSGLRGRGGAGFPTGAKWGFVPFQCGKPVYLLCNADESEPGTFKDRLLMEKNPHLLLEGIAIASYALRCRKSYIYIRGEYARAADILERAIEEAYQRNYLGKNICGTSHSVELVVHRGAGAYICGEETGLISSLEGKKGYPRLKPPFPAVWGFLGCPTIVNNVETLCTIPWIIQNGGEKYAAYGTAQSKGTRLFCLSGWINYPGIYEEELGVSLKELIWNHGGGLRDGARLKCVIPGGSSTPPLSAKEVETVTMDFETMSTCGTFLGSGGVIVIPEHYCLVRVLERLTEFYWDESCGQCTPCREGTGWLYKIMKALERGSAKPGALDDAQTTARQMMGTTICALSDAVAIPVLGFMQKFPLEFEAHLRGKGCPYGEDHREKITHER